MFKDERGGNVRAGACSGYIPAQQARLWHVTTSFRRCPSRAAPVTPGFYCTICSPTMRARLCCHVRCRAGQQCPSHQRPVSSFLSPAAPILGSEPPSPTILLFGWHCWGVESDSPLGLSWKGRRGGLVRCPSTRRPSTWGRTSLSQPRRSLARRPSCICRYSRRVTLSSLCLLSRFICSTINLLASPAGFAGVVRFPDISSVVRLCSGAGMDVAAPRPRPSAAAYLPSVCGFSRAVTSLAYSIVAW